MAKKDPAPPPSPGPADPFDPVAWRAGLLPRAMTDADRQRIRDIRRSQRVLKEALRSFGFIVNDEAAASDMDNFAADLAEKAIAKTENDAIDRARREGRLGPEPTGSAAA